MANRDSQYAELPTTLAEIDHKYGEDFHILSAPWAMTLLARLCAKDTTQPEVNHLITELYLDLLKAVVNIEFPRVSIEQETRMIASTEHGVYSGQVVDVKQPVAVAAVARAGILPAQIVYDRLNLMLDPAGVRQDHFFVSRATDDEHHVTGANVASRKIGGPLDGAILLLPDPMGATGSSILQTLDTYKEDNLGQPKAAIAMHLIVTPEYLRALKEKAPGVKVYAVRLDRGLSAPDVLASTPGERWDEERGLNDIHYIVPGAGGLGELMTNSWV